jgi:hypothetical protein
VIGITSESVIDIASEWVIDMASESVIDMPRNTHLGLPRYSQQLQDAHALPDMLGADPACFASAVNLFKPLMPKAADHSCSVNDLVYGVD